MVLVCWEGALKSRDEDKPLASDAGALGTERRKSGRLWRRLADSCRLVYVVCVVWFGHWYTRQLCKFWAPCSRSLALVLHEHASTIYVLAHPDGRTYTSYEGCSVGPTPARCPRRDQDRATCP